MSSETQTTPDANRRAQVMVLRLPQVTKRIGLSRSAIYARLDKTANTYDRTFPRPISLGTKTIGFVEAEIDAWLESRLTDRRGPRNYPLGA